MVPVTVAQKLGAMRFCSVMLCVLAVALAFSQSSKASAREEPSVTVQPACPNWTIADPPDYRLVQPKITVRYNPHHPVRA